MSTIQKQMMTYFEDQARIYRNSRVLRLSPQERDERVKFFLAAKMELIRLADMDFAYTGLLK